MSIIIKGERVRTHPKSAHISYLTSKKEPLSEEEIERWEENEEFKKLIHGHLYLGSSIQAVDITIFKEGSARLRHGELIEIDDHEVEYNLTKGKEGHPDKAKMSIEFENVSYLIDYTIQEGESEEDAKSLAKEIINHN
ncbi:hypothetical protein [Piscibacillus halophilus]|uniref:hypothetical protein n=1 Tax=Piscibacillus halophilus TaxID=571933 RepID=UPI00158B1D68|nr:hypothetical protein [Piscibacillus halophilus]